MLFFFFFSVYHPSTCLAATFSDCVSFFLFLCGFFFFFFSSRPLDAGWTHRLSFLYYLISEEKEKKFFCFKTKFSRVA